MKEKINLLKSLPTNNRPLNQRFKASKEDRSYHWELGEKYFDGTREQGYGGYSYDGRWKSVAIDMVNHYGLEGESKILDIGCAKGFLLYDFKQTFPTFEVWGVDISTYAVNQIDTKIKRNVVIANAKELPFESNYFDLVVSINSLHNILNVNETIAALSEIQRVSNKYSFVSLGSYKNEKERIIIDDWAVVGTTYANENDWLKVFDLAGYTGDYFWFKPNN